MQNNNDDNNNNEIPERAGYFQGYLCHNANPSMKLIRRSDTNYIIEKPML